VEDLTEQSCEPCEGGVEPMDEATARDELEKIHDDWSLRAGDVPAIERTYAFDDFPRAIDFVNRAADVAEREDHHPNLAIDYNRVTVTLWTHAIDGLSRNDFILAAKLDRAARELRTAAV